MYFQICKYIRGFAVLKLLLCPVIEIYTTSRIVVDLNNAEYKAICTN